MVVGDERPGPRRYRRVGEIGQVQGGRAVRHGLCERQEPAVRRQGPSPSAGGLDERSLPAPVQPAARQPIAGLHESPRGREERATEQPSHTARPDEEPLSATEVTIFPRAGPCRPPASRPG